MTLKFGDHEVTKVLILRRTHATECVYFTFGAAPKSLPAYGDPLSYRIDCAKGTAEAWLQAAFGIQSTDPIIEIVNT